MKSGFSALVFLLLFGLEASCSSATNSEQDQRLAENLAKVISRFDGAWDVPVPPHETPFISGDFNGDGAADFAWLGVNPNEEMWQLFVHFSDIKGSGEIVPLPEFTPDVPVDEVRIHYNPPGEFVTWCGRVPEDCKPDGVPKIIVPYDSIFLQILDASVVLIYWDNEAGRFKRHWIGD